MTIRLRYKMSSTVSSSTAEEKDLGNTVSEVLTDTLNEGGSWKVVLAVSATDVQIDLRTVAEGKFIAVKTKANDSTETPATVQIKKNGAGGEAWDIVPLDSKEGHFLISTESVTALYATNTSGTVVMDVILTVAGD